MLTMILAVGCDNDCVATLLMSCKSCGNWRACRPSHSWEVGRNAWDEGEGSLGTWGCDKQEENLQQSSFRPLNCLDFHSAWC